MESEGKVVEYVKSDSEAGYRELSLSDEVINLFKRIRRESRLLSEFIFIKADGSRVDKMVFVHRLEKAELALEWKGNYEAFTLYKALSYLYNPFRTDERKEKVKKMFYITHK